MCRSHGKKQQLIEKLSLFPLYHARIILPRTHKREVACIVKLKTRRRFYKAIVTNGSHITNAYAHNDVCVCIHAWISMCVCVCINMRVYASVTVLNVSYSGICTELKREIKHRSFRLHRVIKRLRQNKVFVKEFWNRTTVDIKICGKIRKTIQNSWDNDVWAT